MRATLSLPVNGQANPHNLILFDGAGNALYSKFNPATGRVDASIRESGTFVLREYEVSFADIEGRSVMMQDAITRLASRGIMRGDEQGNFNPDDPISRAEFVAALVMAFDLLDIAATADFADITLADWYFAAVASAVNEGLAHGFPDNTFRGAADILKNQLTVMSSNTLVQQMGYIVPGNIEGILARYLDRTQLAYWSEEGIALATAYNVTIFRADGLFAPNSVMTRGDAAVVIYRIFGRVW